MKKFVVLFFVFLFNMVLVQSQSDITTPESSPFALNNGVEGMIQNSVNDATGKVVFSVPLEKITARSVSYQLSLSYNGAVAFDQAKQLHKYNPVGPVGVGFGLNIPKIMVDHKGTAARDDDIFYLVDNMGNSRLYCTKKNILEAPITGDSFLDFELEKYMPYKVRYKVSNADFVNSIYTITDLDYWQITDDNGITYFYGDTENTRENVISWGNWIGNSRNTTGTSKHTIVWNLSKIQDQWGNRLTFTYDKVEQGINVSGLKHTEASYIDEINSSTGSKFEFVYAGKAPSDYYEPHQEQSEPDAYQERYERKFLVEVKAFDNDSQLANTYDFDYTYINTAQGERKMYLDKLTLKDKDGDALPAQDFNYYTSGPFEGGIKKITYPAGGSATYNYENKLLFTNSNDRFSGTVPSSSGYDLEASYVRDSYVLNLLKSINPISGNKHEFKIIRHWWNGENWLSDEFVFPYLLTDEPSNRMDQFLSTFGDDFYAFVYFERDQTVDKAQVYLFHLENDGLTWRYDNFPDVTAEAKNDKTEDPILLSGDGFVALATHRTGRLHTYTWGGDAWNHLQILQGDGQYYFGAANNYILALDEDGGATDMVTGATNHPDNYYFHYLDSERIWRTKSWSNSIDNTFTYVSGTNDPSYLYPYSNMVGFVADNNPEFFLRWNTDYNLIAVDNVLGTHPDSYPMYPSLGSMMTLQNSWYNSFPEISTRFSGMGWTNVNLNPNNYNSYGSTAFGEDFVLMYNREQNNPDKTSYAYFEPNTVQWTTGVFTHSTPSSSHYHLAVSWNLDFFVAGNRIGKFNNQTTKFDWPTIALPGDNKLTYSNTLNYSFVGIDNSGVYSHGLLYRVDKTTGDIVNIDLGNRIYVPGTPKFGGYNHFLSGKSMFLKTYGSTYTTDIYRIIDDEVLNDVYDIVVSNVQIDDGRASTRTIDYTYNNSNSVPDGESTFYGEVIVKNIGFGSGDNGETVKYFNTGESDVQMAGLPTKIVIKDKNGIIVSETETIWKKFIKNFINSNFETVGVGYYVRPEKTFERLKFNGQDVVVEITNSYNSLGLLTSSSKANSRGENEVTSTQYAYQNYTFVDDRNMLNFPYEITKTVTGNTISVRQYHWKLENNRAFEYRNLSGTNVNALRTNSEITKVDSYGNVQESNNGLGISKTTLYGYDNHYPVATIANAGFQDVVNELDVSYSALQGLDATLATELLKLPQRLPEAMVSIDLYDDQGRIVRSIDERRESTHFTYDSFGRLQYTMDNENKVINKSDYYYENQ